MTILLPHVRAIHLQNGEIREIGGPATMQEGFLFVPGKTGQFEAAINCMFILSFDLRKD